MVLLVPVAMIALAKMGGGGSVGGCGDDGCGVDRGVGEDGGG